MFSQRVSTQFNGELADTMFPYVEGSDGYDGALVSVLRATLHDKIGEDKLYVTKWNLDRSDDDRSKEMFKNNVLENDCTFTIINYEDNSRFPDWLLKNFEEATKETKWTRIQRITSFFDKLFDVACYCNADMKSTVLMIGRIDVSRIHYVTCAIFAMFPWYYIPKSEGHESNVTKDDKDLVQSLREVTPEKFRTAIGVFEAKYDFYTPRLQNLGNIEDDWREREIDEMRNRSNNLRDRIQRMYNELAEISKHKETVDRNLLGWMIGEKRENEYTIKQYLIDNAKNVHMIESGTDYMVLQFMQDLTYFNEDLAESFINGSRDPLRSMRPSSAVLSADEMKVLFNALFVDRTAVLQFAAGYNINVRASRVDPRGDFSFDYAAANSFPNPHINRYTCIGGYEQAMLNGMSSANYIAVFEQCAASCASLNFSDGTVMEFFVKEFYKCNKKCVRINGVLYTPKEAANEIKAQEGKENE